ncbi:MAG: HAD hydrolase-like protein [Proteobacteria bacterium]|nr:HAD hydrolase-like protein [Pseudomonadota bacterium]
MDILPTIRKKPFNEAEVLSRIGNIDKNLVWIVGDRLMTDIYLANKIGCKSILVDPLEPSTVNKHGLAVVFLRSI